MSFRFKNTEAYLNNYTKKLIVLTRQEILNPQKRTYRSKLFGNRTINAPINSSGSLRSSLKLSKKLKTIVGDSSFKSTKSFRIIGNSYGEILDEGGKPNKVNATVEGLEKWIVNKPIKLEKIKDATKVAEYMKRKIDRYGVQGTGFLQKIVDKQFDSIMGILPSITEDIEFNLEDILITLGYDKKGETFTRKIK
tara:strand:+ start:143 stop:724 length:582 start_codon:yes stop_codon:yes gene_type:complete